MATLTNAAAGLRQLQEQAMAADAIPLTPSQDPVVATSTFRGPIVFVVVGAGGTGARVIAPLTQMMRRGDWMAIIDHDIVEDRNILRQHFTARDIGMPKAVVLAERYRKAGVSIQAFQQRFVEAGASALFTSIREACLADLPSTQPHALIMVGCVDNAAGRRALHATLPSSSSPSTNATRYLGVDQGVAWIDVGNETRGGQVLMSLAGWPTRLSGQDPQNMWLRGMERAMPQLLRDAEGDVGEGCGQRIDLQTVQVNAMAASAVLNMISWLMLGLPFTAAGAFFSTLNTMQPIRLIGSRVSQLTGRMELFPSKEFAMPAQGGQP